jgi:hypothetical protein
MGHHLTPDEREVRELTRHALELHRSAREALLARDAKVVEMLSGPDPSPIGIARAMRRHVSRVRQIRKEYDESLRRWHRERAEIDAQIAELSDN